MTGHDPRRADAWRRYKALMRWAAIVAAATVLLALIYLKASGVPAPIHMIVATVAGVGFTVLLGAALMGLVFLSNASGHDDSATGKGQKNDDDQA
ncbi:hypothetical protein [Allosphingosinicella flava]|nr:hypothetical protein [Sphingosinicella flava]